MKYILTKEASSAGYDIVIRFVDEGSGVPDSLSLPTSTLPTDPTEFANAISTAAVHAVAVWQIVQQAQAEDAADAAEAAAPFDALVSSFVGPVEITDAQVDAQKVFIQQELAGGNDQALDQSR